MANLLEYTLSLQGQTNASLKRIGINSKDALNHFSALETQSHKSSQAMGDMGKSVNTLTQKLNLLKKERDLIPASDIKSIRVYAKEIKETTKEIKDLKKVKGHVSGMLSKAFQSIPVVKLLSKNPFKLAGQAAAHALTLGIKQDMQNVSFEVLLNSKDSAKEMLDSTAKYSMKTAYDKEAVQDNAKTMLSFGLSSEKVMPTLSAIGDIAMGNVANMNSLTSAYSRMSSTGRLVKEDLATMKAAGFDPLYEISKKTGQAMNLLEADMLKGKISAEMVELAFLDASKEGGRFHKMAISMGQTLGGQLANFMENLNEKFIMLYEIMKPVVMLFLDLGSAALDLAFNGIGWIANEIQESNPVLIGFLVSLGALTAAMMIMKTAAAAQAGWIALSTLAVNMSTKAWWLNNAALLANPITWIIAGIIAAIALIGLMIYKFDGWGEAWKHTINTVKFLFSGFVNYLKLLWLDAENDLLSGIDRIKIAWYKAKSLWSAEEANLVINEITRQSEERQNIITQTKNKMETDFSNASSEFKNIKLNLNDKGIGDLFQDLKSKYGISPPTEAPGANLPKTVSSGLVNGNMNGSKSNEAISTGGTKHNYITINLDSLIKALTIQGNDFKDTNNQMETQTQDALIRVLAMATTAQV